MTPAVKQGAGLYIMPKDSVAVLKLLNSALYDYYEILLNKTRLTDLLSVPKFKLRDVESCV